jgi:polysaccharide pyruvyl transferase WcaK-like protein
VRDPHSLARLQDLQCGTENFNLIGVADMAFMSSDCEPYRRILSWITEQGGRPIVILNVSGLLARRGIETSEYGAIPKHLLERGCSIVILPHVIRRGDDDLAACAQLTSQLGENAHVYLVEDLLNPRQVAWLARQASAVMTGRMHLSILALNQGVPATILSTQGKVAGMLELLGMTEFVLEPESGFGSAAIDALDKILDDPSVRSRLLENLPSVRELAVGNFAGLESP